jgi:hypothetical protein
MRHTVVAFDLWDETQVKASDCNSKSARSNNDTLQCCETGSSRLARSSMFCGVKARKDISFEISFRFTEKGTQAHSLDTLRCNWLQSRTCIIDNTMAIDLVEDSMGVASVRGRELFCKRQTWMVVIGGRSIWLFGYTGTLILKFFQSTRENI